MTIILTKNEYGNYFQSYDLIEALGMFKATKITLIQVYIIKNNRIEMVYDLSQR